MADERDVRTTQRVYQFGGLNGELRIESAEALRALSHPLRSSILRELATPHSVKEVADALGLPVARLYHHVKQLLAHRFIVEVEQRKVGSNAESIYQVAAGRIEVSAELTTPWRSGSDDAGTIVEATARRFAAAFREDERRRVDDDEPWPLDAWFFEAITHLDVDDAREVVRELRAVLGDISKRARRPVRGKASPEPRVGIQIAFVSFPPDKEHRYAELRTSPEDRPEPPRPPSSPSPRPRPAPRER